MIVIAADNFDRLRDGVKIAAAPISRRMRPAGPGRDSLLSPFILRPVATSLLMAAILLVGIAAYQQLPVSALPEVELPYDPGADFLPGASPDVMASGVTAPLERQFGQVAGLNQIDPRTSLGGAECHHVTVLA